jgi:hypothetical protein
MESFDTGAKIAVLENELKNISHEVREHRLDSKEQHKQMMQKIEEIDERLGVIEKWRWMIIGGAVAVGFLLSHFFVK